MSGPSGHDDHDTARRLALLSGRMVTLAELLAAADKTVTEVRRELEQLELADELGDALASLRLPRAEVERLMDDLDQLAGEAHNRAVGRASADAERPADVARFLELLRRGEPVEGRLMVKCPACGDHFESPRPVDVTALDALDDCRYTCPHCGAEHVYETWDHYLADPELG